MFRTLWRHKILVVFIVALLVLFPQASVRPAQMLNKTLLLTVGIDKDAAEYTVSGTAVVNQFDPNGKFETKMVMGKGTSVNAAINNLTANEGREVSLAHCNLLVVGAGAGGDNLADTLGHFLKKFEMSNNALLVYTDKEAAKVQELSLKNKTGAAGGLAETVAAYNQRDVFGRPVTLDNFYKDYLRAGAGAVLDAISLNGTEDALENTKSLAVFKGGRYVTTLTPDQTRAVSFLYSGAVADGILLDGISGAGLDNAQALLHILAKSGTVQTKIKDGRPAVTVTVSTGLRIEELSEPAAPENHISPGSISAAQTQAVSAAFTAKLKADLTDAFAVIKTHKADFMHLYDMFRRTDTANFKKYMADRTVEEMLADMDVTVEVEAKAVV
jgi:hypothetical protein